MKHLATVTLMYDDTGSLQWAAAWNDTADGGDTAKAIIADGSGNVIVTGAAWNGSSFDYRTISYDYSATLQWELGYNSKYNLLDSPSDIAVCTDGGIVVAGQAARADDSWSYATVKYRYRDFVIPADSDSVSTSLRWIANNDQLINTDGDPVERVRYYSNQCYPNIYMMDDSLSYVFFQGVDTTDDDTLARIDMTFEGSNAEKRMLPLDKAEYWNNYYLGHIPDGRPFVPLYTRAVMQDVWPNIDVVYSSNQRGLKYYLVVNPGGEWGAINLKYHGAESLYVDGNDALVIESEIGELAQPQPLAYTMDGYGELTLLGWQPEYDVSGDEVTFTSIGAYSGRLVFEVNWGYADAFGVQAPKWWSTYFTGAAGGGHDFIYDIDSDVEDYLYFAGFTSNTDFPILGTGISQNIKSTGYDAVIGRLNNFHQIRWSTFFGGDGTDRAYGVAVDLNSQTVFACGETNSSFSTLIKFPYSNGFLDDLYQSYIAGFNRITGERNWATGFGGSNTVAKKVEIDQNGNIFLAGNSGNLINLVSCTPPAGFFPICSSSSEYVQYLLGTEGGTSTLFQDGFIAKFNISRQLVWSTFFGGQWVEDVYGITIDENEEDLYLVGSSKSTAYFSSDVFTVEDNGGYFQDWVNSDNNPGNSDGFIARFSLGGNLEWSTFFGGEDDDVITGIDVGETWNGESFIAISGHTNSSSYATKNVVPGSNNQGFPHFGSSGMFDETYGGGDHDPFVAMFDDKTNCIWATYLGGSEDEGLHFRTPMVSISESRKICITGTTFCGSASSSPLSGFSVGGMPIRLQATHGDAASTDPSTDLYLYLFDENATFEFGTYFGGTGVSPSGSPSRGDVLGGIYTDDDHIYVAGGTYSNSSLPRRKPFAQSYNLTPSWPSSQQNLRGFLAQLQTNTLPVSISQPEQARNGVNIYPNPTAGSLSIQVISDRSALSNLTVSNMLGQTVMRQNARVRKGENTVELDLKSLPCGIYLLGIDIDGRYSSAKIIKI